MAGRTGMATTHIGCMRACVRACMYQRVITVVLLFHSSQMAMRHTPCGVDIAVSVALQTLSNNHL